MKIFRTTQCREWVLEKNATTWENRFAKVNRKGFLKEWYLQGKCKIFLSPGLTPMPISKTNQIAGSLEHYLCPL